MQSYSSDFIPLVEKRVCLLAIAKPSTPAHISISPQCRLSGLNDPTKTKILVLIRLKKIEPEVMHHAVRTATSHTRRPVSFRTFQQRRQRLNVHCICITDINCQKSKWAKVVIFFDTQIGKLGRHLFP